LRHLLDCKKIRDDLRLISTGLPAAAARSSRSAAPIAKAWASARRSSSGRQRPVGDKRVGRPLVL